MYYNIYYEIAAIIILVILMIVRYKYFKSDNRIIKQFMSVIVMVFATTIVNIIAAISYSDVRVSNQVMLLIETIYLLMALLSCMLQLEVIIMRFSSGSDKIRFINFILLATVSVMLAINLYGHFVFEYVAHTFVGYPLFNGIYVMYAIMFIQMGVMIAANNEKVRKQTVILTSGIMVIPVICILIQFFNDRLILSEFGAAIAFLIYSYSLEEQDYDKLQITLHELEESKKAAQINRESIIAVNEVKNLFMENISEEFETPINEVLKLSTELKAKCNVKEVEDYADQINDAGNQLLKFVDELIIASKEVSKNEQS